MHNEIVSFLNSKVSGCNATAPEVEAGDTPVYVEASHILECCKSLRDGEHEVNVLQAITGTDYEDRIEVTYILASFLKNTELLLKVKLPKADATAEPTVDSVCKVWKAANFQEREVYDMLGVHFNNHPDHRRILCPDDWEGFPLRKDYEVQEVYNGMTVNPEHKINNADHFYFQEVEKKLGEGRKVTHSWKGEAKS